MGACGVDMCVFREGGKQIWGGGAKGFMDFEPIYRPLRITWRKVHHVYASARGKFKDGTTDARFVSFENFLQGLVGILFGFGALCMVRLTETFSILIDAIFIYVCSVVLPLLGLSLSLVHC